MLEWLPEWFRIFFFSMFPWLEARYVIPYAMLFLKWHWWQALPFAVIGNLLPVPFILLFFKHVEKFLRRYKFWSRAMDWLFARTRKKASATIQKYEHIGLFIFVAIPLPFTGAWTGSLIAYLFDLKFSKSVITIFFGLLAAAFIMIALTLLFGNIFGFNFN
jgi:uncharacterized membrane protein